MPTVDRDGTELYYETDGDGETVAFIPDIGCGAWLWGWQHAAVGGPFESLVWNTRGTGQSDPPRGPMSMAQFANDLEAVLADHGSRNVHLIGCGLGAMVALAYARRHNRARSLTLVSGAATGNEYDPEPFFADPSDEDACRETLDSVLSAEFCREQPDVVDGIAQWRTTEDADRETWDQQAAALSDFDATPLYEVTLPTLVVSGGADELLDETAAAELANGLPRGRHEEFPGAGHFVNVERSRPLNDLLLEFVGQETGT
ncbi:alpha/beta fold hydrolase [Haloarchaeobius sp. DFWS5]|uniref:alpha/beta fold hydrolase n=1 Tax=Haloarchaeobius sp. DFWS5 TaxID=3446114 RepID=UPI003EBC92B9